MLKILIVKKDYDLCNYANGIQHKKSLFKNIISFANKPFPDELIEKDDMLETYSTHWRRAKCICYGTIIIKWILKHRVEWHEFGSCGS